MKDKKVIIGAVALAILGLTVIAVNSFARTSILVALGSLASKTLNIVGLLLLIAAVLWPLSIVIERAVRKQRQEAELERKMSDPLGEFDDVYSGLDRVVKMKSGLEQALANRGLGQLDKSANLNQKLRDAVGETTLPIVENVDKELYRVRVRILNEAKRVYNRLSVTLDTEGARTILDKNDKLLDDADKLILQVMEYVDTKTASTDLDLKNLTESLQDLLANY